jgi:hypothetical protein
MTDGVVCVRGRTCGRVSGPTQTWTKSGTQIGHARTVYPFR